MTLKSKFTLMGIKKGMTQLFDDKGNKVVCTVIEAEKHVVSQIKTVEKDGYQAIQLASLRTKPSKVRGVTQSLKGHFKKAGVDPRNQIKELRVADSNAYQVGQEYGVEVLDGLTHVNVRGVSKGKGYQGVIKRHHFAGGPASHGSGFHRHGGSCGMRSTPGRCLPGQKKAGRMGGERVTAENLRLVKVDAEKQVILVEGSVPGCRGGLVFLTEAKKRPIAKKK